MFMLTLSAAVAALAALAALPLGSPSILPGNGITGPNGLPPAT